MSTSATPPPADRDAGEGTTPVAVIGPRTERERRRFEAYCRWSLHLLLVFVGMLIAAGMYAGALSARGPWGMSAGAAPVVGLVGVGLVVVWIALCLAVVELVTREWAVPRVVVAAFLLLWVVLTLGMAGLVDPADVRTHGAGASMVAGPLPLAVGGAIAVLLFRRRTVVIALLAGILALSAVQVWGPPHVDPGTAVATGIMTLWLCLFVVPTAALTRWMIDVVRRLWRAQQAAADLAVAEERLRFSRDLHDVFGRTLSTVAIKSELAAELARRGDPRAVGEMTAVHDLARNAQSEVRGVVRGYRRIDLAEEVRGARSVLGAAGIATRTTGFDDEPLRGVRAAVGEVGYEALAWVVREGVTNVLRHGDAHATALDLERVGSQVVLTVTNTSPRPVGPVTAGSGLLGLRERLDAVGGTLEAGPTPDARGYRLRALVPAS